MTQPKSNVSPAIFARSSFIRRIAAGFAATGAGLSRTASPRFAANPSVLAVGRDYLAMHPSESDAPFLARSLERSARAQDDFARGDVVVIDGWLVARCEARACALATLTVRDAD